MHKKSIAIMRITSAVLTVALTNVLFMGAITVMAAGKKGDGSPMAGQMIVTGNVTINEKRALNGTTVFSNSKIAVACAKGNSAIVNLGKLGRLELAPGTKILLKFSEAAITGDLLEGKAVVNTPPGIKVSINTPDGVANADGKEATVTPVNSQRGVRCVPAVVKGSSSGSNALSGLSPLALLGIIGVGGAAAAGAAVASSVNTNSASSIIP